MVFISLISSSALINKAFSNIFKKAFVILGVCIKYSHVIILGNLSGFLIGPKLLSEEKDICNEKHFVTKHILLSSNAGLGFVVAFLGQALLGNFLFGFILYFLQILISFILNSFVLFKKELYDFEYIVDKRKPFFESIYNSVASTINAIISICAYTIIFSIISSLIIKCLSIPSSSIFSTVIYVMFDVSQGVKNASLLNNNLVSFFFIGFSVGFGGISVFLQIFSICKNLKLNKLKFFVSKLLQGILCGLISMLLSRFFIFVPQEKSAFSFSDSSIITLIFVIVLLVFFIKISLKSKILLNYVEFLKKFIYNIKVKYYHGGNYGRK